MIYVSKTHDFTFTCVHTQFSDFMSVMSQILIAKAQEIYIISKLNILGWKFNTSKILENHVSFFVKWKIFNFKIVSYD